MFTQIRIILDGGRALAAVFALTLIVYLTMILGPLAQLQAITGLIPFDLRPGGYTLSETRSLLHALGAEGRQVYLWQQIPLDTLYPGLLCVTIILTMRKLMGGVINSGKWKLFVWSLAMLAAVADYLENLLIVLMISTGPDISQLTVELSSAASIGKSVLTSLAMAGLMITAVVAAVIKFPRRRA